MQTDWQSLRIRGNGWLRTRMPLSPEKKSLRVARHQGRQMRKRRIRVRKQFDERG